MVTIDQGSETTIAAGGPMNTTAEIAPSLILLGSSGTILGVKASIALNLGYYEEVYCDEVKLWKARSRESFIKSCLKVLEQQRGQKIKKGESKNISEKIDKWLREQNASPRIFGELKWTLSQ